jgi:DNA-binding transcriptional LysR family regulator
MRTHAASARRLGRQNVAMDLKNIDLQLLINFETLISECHVTRAAAKLGMSQPQMSSVLSRLRGIFDDPLLVRTPSGMQATPHALDVLEDVRAALSHLKSAFAVRSSFDPGGSQQTFKLAASDSLAHLILPGLLRVCSAHARGIKLTLRPAVPNRIRDWLETGEIDLVIGYWSRLADGLHASVLFQQRLCVIAAERHPRIKDDITIDQYLGERHVFFGAEQSTTSTLEASVDVALGAHSALRNVALRVPSLLLTPELVASSDLIATVPVRLVRQRAKSLKLQILGLPFEAARPDITMVWHQRAQKDASHQWLRQQLRNVCEELDSEAPT